MNRRTFLKSSMIAGAVCTSTLISTNAFAKTPNSSNRRMLLNTLSIVRNPNVYTEKSELGLALFLDSEAAVQTVQLNMSAQLIWKFAQGHVNLRTIKRHVYKLVNIQSEAYTRKEVNQAVLSVVQTLMEHQMLFIALRSPHSLMTDDDNPYLYGRDRSLPALFDEAGLPIEMNRNIFLGV